MRAATHSTPPLTPSSVYEAVLPLTLPGGWVCVCVQVTPMLGLLSALRERTLSAEFRGESIDDDHPLVPLKVVFVWACRHAEEFDLVDEALLAEARCDPACPQRWNAPCFDIAAWVMACGA